MSHSSHDLKYYYTYVFPYEVFVKWLSKHSTQPLPHREIAFFWGDLPQRYLEFVDAKQLQKFMIDKVPDKLDIGPVYAESRESRPTKPIEKQLVFDIDINDYDKEPFKSRNNCCEKLSMCTKCFCIMICAMKVINYYLTVCFDFKEYTWIFSGRRGVHCWVSDSSVLTYTDAMRGKVAEYIIFQERYLLDNNPIYAHLYDTILLPCFENELLVTQNYFETKEQCSEFIKYYFKSEIDIQGKIEFIWNKNFDDEKSSDRWKSLVDLITTGTIKGLGIILKRIVFDKVYPKLDHKVTTGLRHLLKAPYSVHPSTGNVCVPITTDSKITDLHKINIKNISLLNNKTLLNNNFIL
jgi:DNA primase small subunit